MIAAMSTRTPTPLPEDWWPDSLELEAAARRWRAIDVERETRQWVCEMADAGYLRKNWAAAWRASMKARHDQANETMHAEWYPSSEAMTVAMALLITRDETPRDANAAARAFATLSADAEALTQQFAAQYDGVALADLPDSVLLPLQERCWTEVWTEWLRVENERRYRRNVAAAAARSLTPAERAPDVGEADPLSRLSPGWAPDGRTVAAARVLLDELSVDLVHEQFHLQFDGRTLESMAACDWIRDEDVTDWPTVWLIYMRQVAVSRRERMAREAREKADQAAAAAAVREQGGLRLLRGTG
ncbi:Uncharacterised protein [Mycobacteroides abscessus subsp. abscessus]|nr:Uncharacterised protein [Mycobacteroides abscessus subsp. abscessus]